MINIFPFLLDLIDSWYDLENINYIVICELIVAHNSNTLVIFLAIRSAA